MKQWKQQDEDVLTYALFPQVAIDFFKYRQAQQTKSRRDNCRHKKRKLSCLNIQLLNKKQYRFFYWGRVPIHRNTSPKI